MPETQKETKRFDELDLTKERKWINEGRAKTAIDALIRKNLNAQYVATKEEALKAVMSMIPPGAKVCRGDSLSVDECGIPEALEKRGQKTIYPLYTNADGSWLYRTTEQRQDVAREAFTADYFLVGTNAITLDGKLINVDAWGNRVSALIFGPKKVIIIAGVNKIVKDLDEGMERIRSFAGPMNIMRHYTKHGQSQFANLNCVRNGVCNNCGSELCNRRITTIIDGLRPQYKGRINVVLVGEELGI